MGALTDYFAATPEQAMTCLEHGPIGTDLPHVELKRVEPWITLGKLWAYAVGAEYSLDAFSADDGTSVFYDEEGPVLIRIKEACTAALAAVGQDEILPLATSWSEIDEWAGRPDPSSLAEVVRDLSRVARAATAPGHNLYAWCLL